MRPMASWRRGKNGTFLMPIRPLRVVPTASAAPAPGTTTTSREAAARERRRCGCSAANRFWWRSEQRRQARLGLVAASHVLPRRCRLALRAATTVAPLATADDAGRRSGSACPGGRAAPVARPPACATPIIRWGGWIGPCSGSMTPCSGSITACAGRIVPCGEPKVATGRSIARSRRQKRASRRSIACTCVVRSGTSATERSTPRSDGRSPAMQVGIRVLQARSGACMVASRAGARDR